MPDKELMIQWNNTHSHTLFETFLMTASAKLRPRTLIPNANRLVPHCPVPGIQNLSLIHI